MRQHNATHDDKVHFYGFDMPLGKMAFASPRFMETVFLPTAAAPAALAAGLTPRTGSTRNPTYFPWTGGCLADYDWLAYVKSTTYQRGGPPLHAWDTEQPPRDDARK